MEAGDGTSNAHNAVRAAESDPGLNLGAVNNGVRMEGEDGVAEGEEVQAGKNEAVNNGVAIGGGDDVAEGGKIRGLKNESVNNEVTMEDADDVAEGEEVQCLKEGTVGNGVAIGGGDDVAEGGKTQGLKNESVNNGVAIADGNGVAESEEVRCLKEGTVDNGVAVADRFGSSERDSGGVECLRTYKRRKRGKSSSEIKVQEGSGEDAETINQLSGQKAFKIVEDGQQRSSQFESSSHRLQSKANGHANVMCNGFSSESDGRGVTERCQHVFRDILASEKFSSLSKVLLENFQGLKPESVFDFSVINSRMKEQAYEQSPTLFLSDIQQVWMKLQNTGNEIVAIAKSLSNMSKTSYYEQFSNWESNSHMKQEQTEECATYKICTCRHCGEKADGTDCLVCDSCEEMYHVSCIEPAVKEIPHKSWFCAHCTASGIGSPHEDCVVCERLIVPKTLNNIVGEESFHANEETLNELEENSNCSYDGIQVSKGGTNSSHCKICGQEVDGEKIKICGHSFCSSKYYHVRCLSGKQIKSYGRCWYCPSCLCQVCFADRDDDKIVLCDGCDHAYHIYCMEPPQNSIPRGKWFCRSCDAGIQAIRQARMAYEANNSRSDENVSKLSDDKKWNNKRGKELDKVGGMDMLLTAANTLKFEEGHTD